MHIPLTHIFVYSVSPFSNWELLCTQIVGGMDQPLGKNTQFVRTCMVEAIKRDAHEICFYWYLLVGLFATSLICSFFFFFFLSVKTQPASQPPTQAHRTGTLALQASSQHIPSRVGYDSNSVRQFQENESSALAFLSIFCNLVEAQLFQKAAPLPVRYLHEIFTKGFAITMLSH